MTALLARMLGRLPLGWLQLTHNKMRMAAALAGVAFANILVFVQLGIMGALNGTIGMSYLPINADIMVSASDANTLLDGSNVSRRYMYQALSVTGVESAAPLYTGSTEWRKPDGNASTMQVYGFLPEHSNFSPTVLGEKFVQLKLQNRVLIDTKTRGLAPEFSEGIDPSKPFDFEMRGMTLSAVDTFAIGGGFSADGHMIMSDQTFLRLFPLRVSGTPTHILIKAMPGYELDNLVRKIEKRVNSSAIKIRTLQQAIAEDTRYQTTERPTGVIFGFGVFIGILVGLVIVYQVLATDVADHLREYATFKAMGYTDRFFLSVIVEEAVVLAVMGFIPGLLLALLMYFVMSSATGLPVSMEPSRVLSVLAGTIIACITSGYLATRRLASANPAELF